MHNKQHTIIGGDHTAGNYKLFYSDGSGALQELAHGTSGQVLKSNGAAAAPSWGNGPQTTVITAVTASTATTVLDLSLGSWFQVTLTCDTVLNLTNVPASGYGQNVIIELVEDATGDWEITGWQLGGTGTTPKYAGGTAPTYTLTAGSRDDLHLLVKSSELTVKLAGAGVA